MNMIHRRTLMAALLPLAIAASPAVAQIKPLPTADSKAGAAAQPPGTSKPVSVNGKAIPKARLDYLVKQRTAQGQPDNEQVRRALLDNLINQEVLAQEAERKGLAKSADIQIQVELSRQTALARAVIDDYLKAHPIREEQLKAQYEAVKSQRGEREYRARHILVDTEASARDITEKLKKGEKFEELAKQSKDPGSKDRGGDLDWAAAGNYVKPFADALLKLEKGKLTDAPIQTQFGWHVIRLDDVRSVQFPPYEQVKQQIQNAMQEQEIQKLVADLRSKAKIE
jgi:peptidyl-prolyl cis-trans isomerase C